MQYYALVVVPTATRDVVAVVTHLMSPYELYREVPPHKALVPKEEIEGIVTNFGVAADDLESLMEVLHEESGFDCSIEDGRLYWITTDNPEGRWDGWKLQSLQTDVWPVSAVPKARMPSAIVTPDGVWHDLGERWDMTEVEKAELWERAEALLEQYPTHLAVILYCHR